MSHKQLGADGPLARSWPAGGENWAGYENIQFNDDGNAPWNTMAPADLDKLTFHEFLHLANANIIDDDTTGDLFNAHSIAGMINNGVGSNIFYRAEKKKANDNCG